MFVRWVGIQKKVKRIHDFCIRGIFMGEKNLYLNYKIGKIIFHGLIL